jgi:hypothetical protein
LEKGNPLHLNKLETPPPKDDLCQVWLKLAHGSGEVENVKVYRRMDRRRDGWTNNGQPAIRTAHFFSSGELKMRERERENHTIPIYATYIFRILISKQM